ncbi:FAD/NAD(P)-binding protein [soil metagenome]
MIQHVSIVGGGFSGTLQAINLLRHDGPAATLIERSARVGDGLAFGAAHPAHVLNVRASNMSAFPDDADHFVRWLGNRGVADPGSAFVPRVEYGRYLRELLDDAVRKAPGRIRIVRGDVMDAVARPDGGARLLLADGESIDSDAVVLAVGNLPPHDPPGLEAGRLSSVRYKADPWEAGVATGLGPDDEVLIIGTGLTMIDVALLLEETGFEGKITALSRRGLLPHAHAAPTAPWDRLNTRTDTRASALVHTLRDRSAEIGWRNAVDELRPFTQAMWANASPSEKERFLRHLRPWWDIHRHRLAPVVAGRLSRMQANGRLNVIAGKTLGFVEHPDCIEIAWRPRGSATPKSNRVQRVVNCTGPQGDLGRTTAPLLARLRDRGLIRSDTARLGIDVDGYAQTIDNSGAASDWLFAIGPMTRGAFWEIVAVPDIRVQTWTLARRLSNAQWVGGEGL